MKNILFVCTGNTCRSPMAKAIFEQLQAERRLDGYESDSAGLAASPGDAASANAVEVMAEWGIDLVSHRSKAVTGELLEQVDIIVAMTPSHKFALESAGVPEEKIIVLQQGIMDPYHGSIEVYRNCRDQIKAALERLVENLQLTAY